MAGGVILPVDGLIGLGVGGLGGEKEEAGEGKEEG